VHYPSWLFDAPWLLTGDPLPAVSGWICYIGTAAASAMCGPARDDSILLTSQFTTSDNFPPSGSRRYLSDRSPPSTTCRWKFLFNGTGPESDAPPSAGAVAAGFCAASAAAAPAKCGCWMWPPGNRPYPARAARPPCLVFSWWGLDLSTAYLREAKPCLSQDAR